MEFDLTDHHDKHIRYTTQKRLGHGAFGEVKLAVDNVTGRKVALKIVRSQGNGSGISRAVFREIQTLMQLQDHVNIVNLMDYYAEESSICLVFEYLQSDLAEVIEQTTDFLPVSYIKSFAQMILRALDHCHSLRIIHRDIKPSNILISANGTVKLADFGLARLLPVDNRSLSFQVATRIYRAPELLFATHRYDFGVDIWSAGAVIAELFTLHPLFNGVSDIDQILRVFQVMGTPDLTDWPEAADLPDYSKVSFSQMSPLDLRLLITTASENDIAFLQTMLVLNPKKRSTAAQLVCSSYFLSQPLPTPPQRLPIPLRKV